MSILLGAVVLSACGLATFTLRPTILSDVQHLIEEDFTSNGDNNGKQYAGGNLEENVSVHVHSLQAMTTTRL